MDFTRLHDLFHYQQQRYPKTIALAGRQPNGERWQHWSTDAAITERDRLSAGMLEMGFRHGQRIGILAHAGSPQWLIADAAMLQIGIVPVPIHTTARTDEIAHIIRDAQLKACWVSNEAMYKKLCMVTLDMPSSPIPILAFEPVKGTTAWSEITCDPAADDLEKIRFYSDSVQPSDIATILYTSGTTGVPKGVMLSHQNIISNMKSVLTIVPINPDTTVVSFLPMSHIFERMVNYVYLAAGCTIWYADSIEKLPETLREVRPHFMTAVPRILERTYERLLEMRDQAGPMRRKILDWAIHLGENYPFAGEQAMPIGYHFKLMLADLLVFRHWRKAMGGRVQSIAVGAAALQPRLGRLFSAAGIDVREGYGLTETSPVIAFNRFEPGGVHFGTVGIPAPGVEVRIAPGDSDDPDGAGEIEVRGPNIMVGYLNLPDATAEKFTPDGWLKTGDLGFFKHKRFLKITGRRSEVFKTSSGKFVAPAFVEQQLLTSPFIDQCMVLGLNRPYVVALIVPNFSHLEAWCKAHHIHWTAPQYMILNPKVEKVYLQEIERINQTALGSVETVKDFHLLADNWTQENGLLTPTLKMRRESILAQFKEPIEEMYKQK
jgi:long-chain acyl-CoA synthetase